ncbi:hypothetical protein F2Q69_00052690 [Brassica cretica]|uniref:Uncharacterized protein n=1 Tax=Brassica cretica TaxID=69181 RepID=A0A8S9MUE6_BRACR|nr:hypothetical protein F2Q69_00052690 [Brassica cretica]
MSSSQSDNRSSDAEMARRKAEKEPVHADTELPSSSVLVVTPTHEPEVQVPQDAGAQVETSVLCVPDALAQPSGSSTIPILVERKEKAAEPMPPPPARKEIVLALRAPSATPVVQPKGRKRKCTRGNDGESLQHEGLSLTSGFRGKFVSLIDGMIRECGFEVQIWELERDIGKTASSLLKEKIARKTKSSEVSRLQRRIESSEGSANHGVEEAKDALRVEFQTRLAKISDFLGSLECIRSRDLALATVDGGMALVQALQGENPSSLQAEDARLSACQGDLGAVDGSFDLILADLKSECFLPTCSEDPEGQDPAAGENGGGAAPSMDEAMGEGEFDFYVATDRMAWSVATAPACVAGFLSFREKLARRKAEKEPVHADTELLSSSVLVVTPTHEPEVQVPQDAGAQVETGILCVPDALAQPFGSSTTLILVEGKEKAAESMPPPPVRK